MSFTSELDTGSSDIALTRGHLWLGYSGLLPFLGLAAAAFVFPENESLEFARWHLSYAALIFSFLGGLLWFASLSTSINTRQRNELAAVAVATMLWAWCWLLLAPFDARLIAGLSFLALLIYERKRQLVLRHCGYSEEFLVLRLRLSVVAALSLLVTAF